MNKKSDLLLLPKHSTHHVVSASGASLKDRHSPLSDHLMHIAHAMQLPWIGVYRFVLAKLGKKLMPVWNHWICHLTSLKAVKSCSEVELYSPLYFLSVKVLFLAEKKFLPQSFKNISLSFFCFPYNHLQRFIECNSAAHFFNVCSRSIFPIGILKKSLC